MSRDADARFPPATHEVEARFLVRLVGDLIHELVTLNNHLAWQITHEIPRLSDAISALTRTLREASGQQDGRDG
jgi:uncharacterized protein with HEPN domain